MRRGCPLLFPSPPSFLKAQDSAPLTPPREGRFASATSRGPRACGAKECPLSWTGGRACPCSKASAIFQLTSGNDFGRAVLTTTRNRSRSLLSRRVPTRCLCGVGRFTRFASFLGAVSQLAIWRGGLMRSTARSLSAFARIPTTRSRAGLFPVQATTFTLSNPRCSHRFWKKWSNRALPNPRPHDIPHRGMI